MNNKITYEEYLKELIERDERFMVMTAENRASLRNIPPHIGNRFVDVGIAEMTLIGTASGMALRGRIPIVHALACFLTMRSFEHIRTDIGFGNLPVKLVGSFAGFLSQANGPTHQAIDDVGLMANIPNVGVFCPSDFDDMMIGLEKILHSEQPFYIRYNDMPSEIKHNDNFEIGKAEVLADGSDITILTYGVLAVQALKAHNILKDNGVSAKVVNLRTVKPIDEEIIKQAAQESQLVVTLEDHFRAGGLFSIISRYFVENGLSAKVLPIDLEERWFKPVMLQQILEYEGFTAEQISEKILKKIK